MDFQNLKKQMVLKFYQEFHFYGLTVHALTLLNLTHLYSTLLLLTFNSFLFLVWSSYIKAPQFINLFLLFTLKFINPPPAHSAKYQSYINI